MSQHGSSHQPPWTIGRLVDWTHKHFVAKEVDAPRLAAELLLAHALGCAKIELYTRFAEMPSTHQLDAFRESVRAAVRGVPVAHILGRKEFYGIELEVTAATLIPRPETETLVDQVLAWCRERPGPHAHLLDLGTGSGAIGLALCRHLPEAQVVGSDVSSAALEVAQRNAVRLNLCERFTAVQADGLDLPATAIPGGGFDVLVSNPPYIAEGDLAVQTSVREHEPHIALFAGPDGLDFYRRIAGQAAALLRALGGVIVEIGYRQHDDVVEILTAQKQFQHVESFRDHLEGHLRVVAFQRSE